MLKTVANYIQDNAKNRCDFCKYETCSEHDDCSEGIFEKLVDYMQDTIKRD